MRLAQLARKVNTKPAEIRQFIKDEYNIELDNDPNVKVEDKHADAVLQKYQVIEEPKPQKAEAEEVKAETTTKEEEQIDPNVDTDIETLKEIAEDAAEEKGSSRDEAAGLSDDNSNEDSEAKTDSEEENASSTTEEKKVVKIQYDDSESEEDKPEESKVEEKISDSANESSEAKAKDKATSDTEEPKVAKVDPDAELIAGEVDKLEGIKVVGKIDLLDQKTKKLMEEEVELPSADKVEDEIDDLDDDLDTSGFSTIAEEAENDEEKEALFAELDKQMDEKQSKVKSVTNEDETVRENLDEDEEEYSIYKNKKGVYQFTLEQKKNREKSLFEKELRERKKREKEKKRRHYEENIAPKVKKKNKKVKKHKQKAEAKAEEKVKGKKQEPKGLWQRFLNWLND